jgi:hypothetical protein
VVRKSRNDGITCLCVHLSKLTNDHRHKFTLPVQHLWRTERLLLLPARLFVSS